jgi:hypothetical protein
MWVALFIFCNPIEGCMAVTFDDQQPYYETQQICDAYTEKKSDLVYEKLAEHGIPGSIHYQCVQQDKKEMEYI